MSNNKNSVKTAIVTILITSILASLVVSFVAVYLKDAQDLNKLFDKQKNILEVSGLIDAGQTVTKSEAEELYKNIRTSVIEFSTGEKIDNIDIQNFDQNKVSKDPSQSVVLSGSEDIAGLKRQEKYGLIYEVLGANGDLETIILPIRGYGLWSTLYGFLALESDGKTVKGITFYQHAETPGLGGEVDNPKWKQVWHGKSVYGEQGNVVLKVIKGTSSSASKNEVDGLSGATITSNGVGNMIKYWFSDKGYGPFLKKNYIK